MKTVNDSDIQNDDYVGRDLMGYPYNRKYPPDIKKYGSQYSGYRTFQQETFFYDYAILCYDVRFTYKGTDYFIIIRKGYCARTDSTLRIEYEKFPNANALIEQLTIDGVKLIDFMNQIEEVEVF